MDIIFLKNFDGLKIVEDFPNPDVKNCEIDGKLVQVNKTCKITIKKVPLKDCLWHGVKKGSYMGTSENGFFPTRLIYGITKGMFDENHEYSKKYGAQRISGNMGTATKAFTNLEEVVKILTENNFEIKIV